MLLFDDVSGRSLAEYSTLIKPDGWTIDPGAAKAHGFTDEMCEQYGVSGRGAFSFFQRVAGMADLIVAHNTAFDKKLMEIEAEYLGLQMPDTVWYCTMEASRGICNLPPTERMLAAGINEPKAPKLEEALTHICGRSLGDTAHDAMYDVKACRDIYLAIHSQQ